MSAVVPAAAAPGQESVWAYPRPAIAEPCARRVEIRHRGKLVASTDRSIRTLETSHPPSYYIPREDIDASLLRPSRRRSLCEWKGLAHYLDVAIDGVVLHDVGWCYPAPTEAFACLRDHIAFYAAPFDECRVDGAIVIPQPGGFYGGWITGDLAGPFKGVPGSAHW